MGYLPADMAEIGADFTVMYMNELFPIKVGAIEGSVFDPDDTRLKG